MSESRYIYIIYDVNENKILGAFGRKYRAEHCLKKMTLTDSIRLLSFYEDRCYSDIRAKDLFTDGTNFNNTR